MRVSFSDEIRDAIRNSGMSQYAIAKSLGLSQALVSRFMHGKSWLGVDTLDRLAALLDLHIQTRARRTARPRVTNKRKSGKKER
jgi:transcriptional regulator with XRE-family HTH domain